MIADLKIFAVKKWQNLEVVFAVTGVLVLVLTGVVLFCNISLMTGLVVVAVQAGFLFFLGRIPGRILERAGELLQQCKNNKYRASEAELTRLKKSCAARSLFIATVGAELLETSRAMYDVAGFLHSKRRLEGKSPSGGVEKDLLKNADWVYGFSRDLVALTQLKKGGVEMLEQEIDPVELLTCCVNNVCKELRDKQGDKQIVTLVSSPDQPVLITGDLIKLQQLLTKFLTASVQLLQIDGANVQVSIFIDSALRLVFSVKLEGRQLDFDEFDKLGCPLDNFSDDDERIDLDMAIAKGLAQLHGGDIVVGEQTSSGTVLAFFLPRQRVSNTGVTGVTEIIEKTG